MSCRLAKDRSVLSVANVRTAGGAASYFAADNYYTRADADRSGAWFGKGAEELGLTGAVDAKTFEAVLKGFAHQSHARGIAVCAELCPRHGA
jgi:hypothetical protein